MALTPAKLKRTAQCDTLVMRASPGEVIQENELMVEAAIDVDALVATTQATKVSTQSRCYTYRALAAAVVLLAAALIETIAVASKNQSQESGSNPSIIPFFRRRDESETPPPFAFYVMGDVPYNDTEAVVLDHQLEEMTTNRHTGSAFAVHVGDFQRWQATNCSKNTYTDFRTTLLKSPVPMLVLAGDNDYLDCPNKEEARGYFLETFSTMEKNWNDRLPPGIEELRGVNKWWSKRPEMFSFVSDGILFLSCNLLNAEWEKVNTPEWNSRMNDSAAWILQESESAFSKHDIRGIVMFSHAEPSHLLRGHYLTVLEQVFKERLELPVLNIHGDGHVFEIDTRFRYATGWTGFTDIQVDQGGKADPLLVEVAPLRNGVMEPLKKESDMQHVFGDGLFRIDRQKGRYLNL